MAQKFRFDDEDDVQTHYEEPSHIDELEDMKKDQFEESLNESYNQEELSVQFEDVNEEEESMNKKKKKFVWKWWYYVLIFLLVLFIALALYLFMVSRNDGPVYGNRCEGLVVISKDIRDSAIGEIRTQYPEIQDISFEIACRQLKVDITYQEGMDTEKAKQIAEEAVQKLDQMAGYPKDENSTYSHLFGEIDNVSQYEVNMILISKDSEDFPIYGTKHTQKDSFSYTLASVKDKESQQKALDTLKKENNE